MRKQAAAVIGGLAVVGIAVFGGIQASSGAEPAATRAGKAPATACLEYGVDGFPTYSGHASDALNAADAIISQLDDLYPETVLGSSLCSDYSGIVLFTTATDKKIDRAIRDAKKLLAKGEKIHVQTSAVSLDTAQQAITALVTWSAESADIVGFAPDIVNGGVYVLAASVDARDRILADSDLDAAVREATGGVSIPIRVVVSDQPQAAVAPIG